VTGDRSHRFGPVIPSIFTGTVSAMKKKLIKMVMVCLLCVALVTGLVLLIRSI